ncbi:hypothetical protein [Dehalococcoides sp. THU4]|uniref:hypothetical protein n=1 Tax=Dehalococcoides sp. THU4 TaxID=3348344 RepID=UPI003723D831
MRVVYETKGKAREYFELAVNLYSGCTHGCTYCYAPQVAHKSKLEFQNVQPRVDLLKNLELDCAELEKAGETRHILMSFLTDPYQPLPGCVSITGKAIHTMKTHGLNVAILSKAGDCCDLDLMTNADWFGQTLTFDNPHDSRKYEPNAANPLWRVGSLRVAHNAGIQTFASCEPIINPTQTLNLIEQSAEFVDRFLVGKWNYDKRADLIDWAKVANRIIERLDKLGKSYYIKKDLAAYIGHPEGMRVEAK